MFCRNNYVFDSTNLLKLKESIPNFAHQSFCNLKNEDSIICYTDGSCVNNGKLTVAGIGIFWSEGHVDNVSKGLKLDEHTNNRTEMLAIIHAIEIAIKRGYHRVVIRTDSELIVKTMNEWLKMWKVNGWRRVNNKPIKNIDLIQIIDSLCTQLDVSFEHIKGSKNEAHILAKKAMIAERKAIKA